jgi:hypothetical protein
MTNGNQIAPWYRTLTGWLSCASLLISVAVAAFTWLQWREMHNDWLFKVKPHVDFDAEDDPDLPPVGLELSNGGPGPALIKSVRWYVDRKPVRDSAEALEYGKINSDIVAYIEFDPDDTLAVGDKVWLMQYRKPHGGKKKGSQKDEKDLNDFLDFIDYHVAVKVHYCTVTEDPCWDKCSTKDRC